MIFILLAWVSIYMYNVVDWDSLDIVIFTHFVHHEWGNNVKYENIIHLRLHQHRKNALDDQSPTIIPDSWKLKSCTTFCTFYNSQECCWLESVFLAACLVWTRNSQGIRKLKSPLRRANKYQSINNKGPLLPL